MHKFKYALSVIALLSACSLVATAEAPIAQTEASAPQTLAAPESVPASEPAPVVSPKLDKAEFKVVASSQQSGSEINNAFDGSPETMWHSNWSDAAQKHPYTIDIDIGKLAAVNGLGYLPRDNFGNGAVKDYEIYVSRTSGEFGEPVAKGSFAREMDPEKPGKPKYQKVSFPTTWGRYVRVKVLSALNGDRFGSVAELDVMQDIDAAPFADEICDLGDKTAVRPSEIKGETAFNKGISQNAIVVDGNTHEKGITVRAGTEIVYNIDGAWDQVQGFVGREAGGKGAVTFRIFADGKEVFKRIGHGPNDVKQPVAVDIAGAKQLVFRVIPDNAAANADTGVWVELKLVRKGSEE
ncbi:MAG: NPCBM/NEW2 domain-containing protein [Opitutales bacterium]|nr:NPCBM/NEW2 domain-containing protein [Opitutales bacterium]